MSGRVPFRAWLGVLVAVLAAAWPAPVDAHPVPRSTHDRTITVRLTTTAICVEYCLEIDEWTVVYQDLPAVLEQVDLARLSSPNQFYEAFTRSYAPILADNLLATLDGQALTFRCSRWSHQVLDHLRCEFVFEAPCSPRAALEHAFTLREGNYELESGAIRLSLTAGPGIELLSKVEPDEEVKARQTMERRPGDEALLRRVAATFQVQAVSSVEPPSEPVAAAPAGTRSHNLLALLLDSRQGLWVLLFLAACFGAAHALTPGHGKTLVAAYLIGERGTVLHALILGLVTTLTHTGAVLVLAAVLLWCYPGTVPEDVQVALGRVGGLLVAGLGCWLLLRRLSGGADHFHLGGHSHHHGHAHSVPGAADAGRRVGWWGLIVLGISGGIVPCWDAIAMFGFAVSAQRLWLALPLLLAFSAGLASVLIIIGIGVVYAKGLASSRWGSSKVFEKLPLVSALLVTSLGLWLCYDSVHREPAPVTGQVRPAP